MKGNHILAEWRTKLGSYFKILTDEMNQDGLEKRNLRNKLQIAKALG